MRSSEKAVSTNGDGKGTLSTEWQGMNPASSSSNASRKS